MIEKIIRNKLKNPIKVSKIKNLQDDIALNLGAKSIRIEAPIPDQENQNKEDQNTPQKANRDDGNENKTDNKEGEGDNATDMQEQEVEAPVMNAKEGDENTQYDEEALALHRKYREIPEDPGGLLREFIKKEYLKDRYHDENK